MSTRPSTGTTFRLDTGPPPPENVEPAGQQPGGPNRGFRRSTTGNNLHKALDRQVCGLFAVVHTLLQPIREEAELS
jgi:hypothetical protein